MHIKKRICSVILCFIMVMGVLEIGSLNQSVELNSIFVDKPTIYFWYTDEELSDYISSMALKFNEDYGVRVTPVLQSGLEYLEHINQESLHSETIPDVYLISNDSLEKAYLSGLASPIQHAEESVNVDNFSDAAIHAVTYQGKILGYPYYGETSALIYNKTYLEEWAKTQIQTEIDTAAGEAAQALADETDGEVEDTTKLEELNEEEMAMAVVERVPELVPETFDDLLNFANTYDAQENVEAVFKWDVEDIFYNYFFVGNYISVGGEYGDSADNINIYNEDAIEAMEFYQALNQFFYIEADEVDYVSVIEDFMAGKLVFTTATTGVVKQLEEAIAEGEFAYEYGVAEIPNINEELLSKGLSVTNTLVVNGYSEQKDLANQFAKYLAMEQMDSLYERTGKMAVNKNHVYENDKMNYFMAEYGNSMAMPKMMTTSNFWVQLEIAFANIWNGASVSNTMKELSDQIMTQVTGEEQES